VIAKQVARLLAGVVALVLAASAGGTAHAEGLSTRPITIIVPFTPGTGIDILARTVGEQLKQLWGQPVVVENRAGASGNIGTQAVARAEPDGHTLLMTVNTFVMNPSLFKTIPYDPVTNFAPIIEVAKGAVALVTHPSVPAETTQAFIAHARARPGALNYASPGIGTPQHLAMELFKLTAKVDLTHVPYKGSAGAVTDLIGGHVSAMFLPVHTALPLAHKQQIRILAVGSPQRSSVAPDVPTLLEAGVSGFEVDLWYGLLAPAGTPSDVIARYNTTVNEILHMPQVAQTLAAQGLAPIGGTPASFGALIATDRDKWAKVIKDAGITAE
jgi:tripartite-type tricarboxylate transporter receptor subunit TctC